MSRPAKSVGSASVGSNGTGYSSYAGYAASTDSNYTVATQYTNYSEDAYNMLQPPPPGTCPLPCEFVGIGSCDVQFHYEDTEAWINHIISDHLQNKLPQKVDCWFCNEYSFDSKDSRGPRGDRLANFYNRMEHIRSHIADGKTALDMVPDFHMLDHLHKHRLISEQRFNEIKRAYHGLPCPRDHMIGIFTSGFVPPERRQQAERSNMVQIDHVKEERQRKKDRRKR
ncbi:uncharacterized protein GGS22DRAFT_45705 [Annulohypoxylon maeteangense]|uniref:uncharacterized protein n=1 Tax=Annulohypoxylon maeteangense TaxID=1927788 RepID=UPI0020086EC4|nr:uncharacterized protein GGS22DRAFT_45705 [Annulohypoxylon maeteangense]KAI0882520.1 hypothetical protein GGS22DRAFT_45705 [Annulohypoxylon maeteangense]